MKLSPWYLAALATLAPLASLGGVAGVFAGHAAVLAITVSIFLGTLSLRRETARPNHPSETPVPVLNADDKS
ncbi:MAG: hypothetical protein U0165_15395 [Polyangiaceae bacterium]